MAEQEEPPVEGGWVSKKRDLKPGAPNFTPEIDDEPGETGAHEVVIEPTPEREEQRSS